MSESGFFQPVNVTLSQYIKSSGKVQLAQNLVSLCLCPSFQRSGFSLELSSRPSSHGAEGHSEQQPSPHSSTLQRQELNVFRESSLAICSVDTGYSRSCQAKFRGADNHISLSHPAPRALGTWTVAKAQSSHSSNNEIERQQFPIWSHRKKPQI